MGESLGEIEKEMLEEDLPLKEDAKNLVFGKGNPEADVLLIGEAPGREEDKQGLPFVGRAGKQLDGFLRSIGLTLDDVYIANVLKYRPPDNRDPKKDEIRAHAPYLIRQVKAISPEVIITLGNFATKLLLAEFNPDEMESVYGISKLHGNIRYVRLEGQDFKIMPMYHPAAMLYNPDLKEKMKEDFRKVGSLLEGQPVGQDKRLSDFT